MCFTWKSNEKCLIVALSMDISLWKQKLGWKKRKEKNVREKNAREMYVCEHKMLGNNCVERTKYDVHRATWTKIGDIKAIKMTGILLWVTRTIRKSDDMNCPYCPLSFFLLVIFSFPCAFKRYVDEHRICVEPRSVCHWYDDATNCVYLIQLWATGYCQSHFACIQHNKRSDFSQFVR